ncbi:hypothetical protein L3Y34_012739 [Caenorhabditis briggsae]|uniref:Transposase Tc5 C-terminal domain-containing protein n=2 Tax=Caenorhabditis briggsae TaxID=6238 RepID=A0AAE8ZZT9_CAEBR|nr:hypothetical protein L3Y34_012739 [Caenorhabditis briggsae]
MTTFQRVLEYILDTNDNNPKRPPMSEEDLKLAAHLIHMGESINKGDYEISSEEHISNFEEELQDKTWTPNTAFMKCIYCDNHLCFEDFIIQHHNCC